jgi:phosphatidylglycerophosphate synthase
MTTAPLRGSELRRRVLPDLAAGLAATLLVAGATWSFLDLPASYVATALLLYGLGAAMLLGTLPTELPGPGVGPANRVTLGRLALLMALAALSIHPDSLGPGGRWTVVAVGTLIMVLDGVDGWVARRTGSVSDYGARFDMETDAFLMLVLSVLVWTEGRVGIWVLLIGAMRYLFVGAAWVLPALRGELFHSMRRKVVCVVQGVALLVCLGPIVPGRLAVGSAAVALAALTWSFGVDTVWLLRTYGSHPDSSAPPV